MSRTVTYICKGDHVHGLAGGPIPIGNHGIRSTRRVSHVEFDPTAQVWVVTDAKTGQPLYSHVDYDAALAWEVSYYNQELAKHGLAAV